MKFDAFLFDFDGTLTRPGALDFNAIRVAINCPENRPILEYINSISTPADKEAALKTLIKLEVDAARRARPNSGAERLLGDLRKQQIPFGIVSRNCRQSIETALRNFDHLTIADFAVVVSRNDSVKPKPSGEGILFASASLKIPTHKIIFIGDYLFDIEAGQSAGVYTVHLNNTGADRGWPVLPDLTIDNLDQLLDLVVKT